MEDKPLRIVQISDMHVMKDKEGVLLGVKTRESFDAVIALLKTDQKPDLIILSGDLSQDGSKESYTYIADQISAFSVPVYCVEGNHDRPNMMNEVYPRGQVLLDKHIILKNWHIVLLNSQKLGKVEGYLDKTQLNFLEEALKKYPERHAITVFHHQPVPMHSAWLDQLGLTNADEFWALLAKFPQMKTILFGHVHQQYEGEKNGVQYFSLPSTCIQFKNSNDFSLEEIPPGYRWMDLYPDGTHKTGVRRVTHYVGVFDKNAKGY